MPKASENLQKLFRTVTAAGKSAHSITHTTAVDGDPEVVGDAADHAAVLVAAGPRAVLLECVRLHARIELVHEEEAVRIAFVASE